MGIKSYLWDFGDNNCYSTAYSGSAGYNYGTAGVYNVTLTITDNNNNSSSVTKPVIVSIIPVPPVADFNITTDNLTATLTNASTRGSSYILDYAWDFGNGPAAGTKETINHSYPAPGTYDVKLTVIDANGKKSTATKQVTVGNTP